MGRNRAQRYDQGQQLLLEHKEQEEMRFTEGTGVTP